jgi:apolipoprotein N-acyltransferase
LSLGYSQTDTWLAGFAPLLGVYGISALLLVQAGALVALFRGRGAIRAAAGALLILPWLAGLALGRIPWTEVSGVPVSVAIVQGAIPQDMKWQAANREATKTLYLALNDQALGAKLILWPESAVPELANDIQPYLGSIYTRARIHGSDVVMGVVRLADNGVDYYNSIVALTDQLTFYDKRHLVPFGEYFPVPAFVRRWLRLMSLPYSDFTPGEDAQGVLRAGGLQLAPTICYEDAYGSAQLALLHQADVLVNVTNDAWFGRSSARYQHFQIARMRALEAQRYLLRAANDGVSALIGPRGEVLDRANEYQGTVLRGTVEPRRGLSPYAWVGNWPVIVLGLLGAALAVGRARRVYLKVPVAQDGLG